MTQSLDMEGNFKWHGMVSNNEELAKALQLLDNGEQK
jgi:hypothetical protein